VAFVFRLEKVLSVRCIQEEAAQQRLTQARETLERSRAELGARQAELLRSAEELDGLKRGDELTQGDLYLHSLHLAGLRRRIQAAREAVDRAVQDAEAASAELLQAHQAREALEKLRERDQEAWRADQSRREAKHLDEMAVSRHRAREEENHGP